MKQSIFTLLTVVLLSVPALGGGVMNPCEYYNPETEASGEVLSNNKQLVLKIDVTKYDYICEGSTRGQAIIVRADIKAIDGDQNKIPNAGWIDGRFEAFDANKQSMEVKDFMGSYFLISSYPFSDEMKHLKVAVDHFPEFMLHL